MIRFVVGKMRGGKTKRLVIWIIEMLRTTNLPIVTNAALELKPWVDGAGVARPGLLKVLERKYNTTFDAERRIVLISNEEVKRFYAIRPRIPRDDWEPREILTVPVDPSGQWRFDARKYSSCCYGIDEAHVYFPGAAVSADYKPSPELLGWASQCGRMGDQCLFLTQVPENVNKRLRTQSQECWVMTNHRHNSMGFLFRQPDQISEVVYAQTPPGPGEKPMRMGMVFYKRHEIDSSYNTSAGVGVVGATSADIGRKARGLPWYTFPIGVLLAGWLFWWAWGYVSKVASMALQGEKRAPTQIAGSTNASAPTAVAFGTNSQGTEIFTKAQVSVLKDLFRRAQITVSNEVAAAVPPIKYYSWMRSSCREPGRAERVKYFVTTELGLIEGKSFSESGIYAVLDGQKLVKALAPSEK